MPHFGVQQEPLPPWGPSPLQLSRCRVDAHIAARGEDRNYGEEGNLSDEEGEEGEEMGGEDADFGMLEAVERADFYRDGEEEV